MYQESESMPQLLNINVVKMKSTTSLAPKVMASETQLVHNIVDEVISHHTEQRSMSKRKISQASFRYNQVEVSSDNGPVQVNLCKKFGRTQPSRVRRVSSKPELLAQSECEPH
jgi:hypothetical protein